VKYHTKAAFAYRKYLDSLQENKEIKTKDDFFIDKC